MLSVRLSASAISAAPDIFDAWWICQELTSQTEEHLHCWIDDIPTLFNSEIDSH